MDLKKYTLKVYQPDQWSEVHDQLCSTSSSAPIPDRSVDCFDEKEHSDTRSTYWLTDAEAEALKTDHRVEWIELDPTEYPDLYPKP